MSAVFVDGSLERPSSRTWQRDARLGANTLTIANGHVIDALRFVVGHFARVAVTTQARQWYETDTQQMVEVTAPDNVLVSGQLASGAVASSHVAAAPWAGRLPDGGLRAGRHAGRDRHSLVAARRDAVPVGRVASTSSATWRSLSASCMSRPTSRGDPFNVGQMYAPFAAAIRTGQSRVPTFDTAVDLHRFIDTIAGVGDGPGAAGRLRRGRRRLTAPLLPPWEDGTAPGLMALLRWQWRGGDDATWSRQRMAASACPQRDCPRDILPGVPLHPPL